MIKLISHTLLYITASLLLHFNANAQTTWGDVDYGEKIETIRLAKEGDADALFKLGLSHFNNSSSAQGHVIAERFFYYASKKGHDEAKQYLIALHNINGVNPTIKPAHTDPIKSKNVKPESKIQTNKSVDEQTIAAATVRAPKHERAKSAIESNIFVDEQIITRKNDHSGEPETITLDLKEDIASVETSYVKVAANFNQNSLIKSDVQSRNLYHPKIDLDKQPIYKTIWPNTTNLLFFITNFLFFILFLLIIAKFTSYTIFNIRVKKALPRDFNSTVYLTLNPDVKLTGLKAETHYILHGKREGRQYKCWSLLI